MEPMYLIVGLGNPGAEYAGTRHNAGFLLVERLAARWRAEWTGERKFAARVARAEFAGRKVLLVEPQTYMNLSGEAVGAVMKFYQLPADRLVVVVDDADLPVGELRLRPGGGAGGHHGLESVTAHLGTPEYARLRLGIGRRDGLRRITGHVLGKIAPDELAVMEQVWDRATAQLECWISAGLPKAMSQFNGVVGPRNEEK
jgi:PTH1 family peptidyl-tRNA hydrolase